MGQERQKFEIRMEKMPSKDRAEHATRDEAATERRIAQDESSADRRQEIVRSSSCVLQLCLHPCMHQRWTDVLFLAFFNRSFLTKMLLFSLNASYVVFVHILCDFLATSSHDFTSNVGRFCRTYDENWYGPRGVECTVKAITRKVMHDHARNGIYAAIAKLSRCSPSNTRRRISVFRKPAQ